MKEIHVFSSKYYAGRNKTRFIINRDFHRRYMAGILPIRRKTLNNQSINQRLSKDLIPMLYARRYYMYQFSRDKKNQQT